MASNVIHWFTGENAPFPPTVWQRGTNDFYLQTSNGDIWQLIDGNWTVIGNIEGGGSTTSSGLNVLMLMGG